MRYLQKHPDLSPVQHELFLWEAAEEQFYWRVIQHAQVVGLDSADYHWLTRELLQQVYKGEKVASSVPMYADVWNVIGSSKSPFQAWVNDDDKKYAVNTGFWELMEQSEDRYGSDARRQLEEILAYPRFLELFDYTIGATSKARVWSFSSTLSITLYQRK
jgi:hypothetical protein